LRRLSLALLGAVSLGLTAPAVAFAAPVAPAASAPANGDPWEHFNRKVFAFNQVIDKHLLRPVALGYMRVVPGPIRDGLHNVLSNLTEPVIASNDILQGRFHQAGLTTARLVANTTIGIGGIFDVASKLGAPHHSNGFDITMGRYHVKPGPYLYIPFLGPSSIRDVVGFGVDGLLDPLQWTRFPHKSEVNIARPVIGGIDLRGRVDDQLQSVMSEATDPYATLRSVYMQNEESQIHAGQPVTDQALPDYGDPSSTAAPAPAAPVPPAPAPSQPAAQPAAPSA